MFKINVNDIHPSYNTIFIFLFSSVRLKDLRVYHKINLDVGNNQRRCLIRIFQFYYSLTDTKYLLSC